MIYLDHNATTPLHPRVLEAMLPHLTEAWGNPSSPYRFGQQARAAVEQARARIAEVIGARPEEIVFCSSGTGSVNLAIRGALGASKGKDHLVTSRIEHPGVSSTCRALEARGWEVSYLTADRCGVTEVDALELVVTSRTALVTVMHANNETGVVQPIERIAQVAKSRGVTFHVDAVQSMGKLTTRLADLGADLVSFSGHKIAGPKGIAALYVRKGTPLRPMITGGSHEGGRRAGTENVAAIAGLAEAVVMAAENLSAETDRIRGLRDRFERDVRTAISDARINGAGAPRVPNTSNLSFDGVDGESIVLGMDMRGICISTGSACSTGEPEPSAVLLAMGLPPRLAQGSVRVSLGAGTTGKQVDTAARILAETVVRLREISSAR